MKLIICSRVDPASQNIKNALLSMKDFERQVLGGYEFYLSDDIAIADIDSRLIYADGIDEMLAKIINFDEILFASRHSSKDGRKIITAHCTGNAGRADFGGKPYNLAKPSPMTMKNFSILVAEKLQDTGYEFTLEATHHGPSEIGTPSAFYEIGSTEEEWRDEEIAWIVAESMLEAIEGRKDWKVAVGVGGTHYVPRQTEIELGTVYAFAHNFPKYTFEDLNEDFLAYAVNLSDAEVIIIDEKSVNSKTKALVNAVAEKLGIEVLKSKQAKKHRLDI